ncbi:DUF6708 domain-containing protein, partial [Pseudomonadota bacterium AL_CKDN230030165-1A_HGKHYDSX7]
TMIVGVYRDGIAVGDGAMIAQGDFVVFGILALCVCGLGVGVGWGTEYFVVTYIGLPILFLLMVVTVLGILVECTGYRHMPVLFDRAAGRIYLIRAERDWLRPWRWFRIPVKLETMEWARTRALIVPTLGAGGTKLPRTNYALHLVQTDEPNGTRIVSSIGVGVPSVYDGGREVKALWEHLRRFMQEGGPHLQPGESVYVDDSSPAKLWNALWWWQPLIGPGARKFWTGPYWMFTIPFGLFVLPLAPLTMLGGFLRWLAYQCKRPAPWPAEVLASVGPQTTASAREGSRGRASRDARAR